MNACFLGLGSIGTRHCLNFAEVCRLKGISAKITAIRSTGKPLRPELAGLGIREIGSMDDMEPFYDCIFITNPTSMHYESLLKAGNKARYFFIEKPVFDQLDADLSAIPFPEGAKCYVAAPLRYTGVLQKASEILKEERIYAVRSISSSYLPDWRPGTDYRTTYSAHKELGGGVSIDLIHEWDYLSMLFGFPKEVLYMNGQVSHLEIDSEDIAVYMARYHNMFLELHLDYFGRKTIRKMEVFTEKGLYCFDIAGSRIIYPDMTTEVFKEEANEKYLREMEYFFYLMNDPEAISSNSIEHAIRVLKLAKGELVK